MQNNTLPLQVSSQGVFNALIYTMRKDDRRDISFLVHKKKSLSQKDLRILGDFFYKIMKDTFGVSDRDAAERIAEVAPAARTFAKPLKYLSNAMFYYLVRRDIPDAQTLDEIEVKLQEKKPGYYLPYTIRSDEELEQISDEVCAIIQNGERVVLSFVDFIDEYRKNHDKNFVPACIRSYMYLDPGSNCNQRGILDSKDMARVLDTKAKCFFCPLKRECLASSLTSPLLLRISQREILIPNAKLEALSLDRYLMFGGFTPQERKAIYLRVCEKLGQIDPNFSEEE